MVSFSKFVHKIYRNLAKNSQILQKNEIFAKKMNFFVDKSVLV